jgi:hypothetical protein
MVTAVRERPDVAVQVRDADDHPWGTGDRTPPPPGRLADDALYAAKAAGRDTFQVTGGPQRALHGAGR